MKKIMPLVLGAFLAISLNTNAGVDRKKCKKCPDKVCTEACKKACKDKKDCKKSCDKTTTTMTHCSAMKS